MRRFLGLFAAFLAAMVLVISAYGAAPQRSVKVVPSDGAFPADTDGRAATNN
jgi:hypothetical protein